MRLGTSSSFVLLLASIAAVVIVNNVHQVDAFQGVVLPSVITAPPRSSASSRLFSELAGNDNVGNNDMTSAASSSSSSSSSSDLVANTMDETIYNFNKILIDTVYQIICFLYPVKGNDRDFARFYVLETVARVPYFAYLSVMHLRETFGERYGSMSERMRTHYAEADNELHHLLIMEELGGNSNIVDRTVAQTMAFFYYWYVIAIYAWNEPAAYHLSELIEDHAFNTYSKFVATYEDRLKGKPVPAIASKYYERDNPFLFDLFCTVKAKDENGSYSTRRPELKTLYDVFVNIRDDEREHWKTLCNLVQFNDMNAIDASEVKSTEPLPSASDATN